MEREVWERGGRGREARVLGEMLLGREDCVGINGPYIILRNLSMVITHTYAYVYKQTNTHTILCPELCKCNIDSKCLTCGMYICAQAYLGREQISILLIQTRFIVQVYTSRCSRVYCAQFLKHES